MQGLAMYHLPNDHNSSDSQWNNKGICKWLKYLNVEYYSISAMVGFFCNFVFISNLGSIFHKSRSVPLNHHLHPIP